MVLKDEDALETLCWWDAPSALKAVKGSGKDEFLLDFQNISTDKKGFQNISTDKKGFQNISNDEKRISKHLHR